MIEFLKIYSKIIPVSSVEQIYMYTAPSTALNSTNYKVMMRCSDGEAYVIKEFGDLESSRRYFNALCNKLPVLNLADVR